VAYKTTIRGGSHPRLEDYQCSSCEFTDVDVYFSSRDDVTPTRPCSSCGEESERMIAGTRRNFIHPTHSSMYGKFEPGLGCVVESYGHKQRLMREFDVQESSDTTKGSRNYQVSDPGPRSKPHGNWVGDPISGQ